MEESKIRKPVVAGQFYPSSPGELKKQIEGFIDKKAEKSDVIACMLPHAGYIYSGKVATEVVSCVNIKDRIILLGPNHTGYGADFSIMSRGSWLTPFGEVKIDEELARQIIKSIEYLQDEPLAHLYEHSLEVELPILQYFKSSFKIVPITILSDDVDRLKNMGASIAHAIIELNIKDSVMLIASSDMTHYEPQAVAEKKDKTAIQSILELDEDKLIKKIRELNITMCGYAPVIAMLTCAKLLGAKHAKLIKYQTSGDITGDKTSVVGYAGITIY